MKDTGAVYGEALYGLAREEGLSRVILWQLHVLRRSFAAEPGFLRLLSAPNLPRVERCQILEDCFRGQVDVYVLNFLKILTEKGHLRHFPRCVRVYENCYNRDHGILMVTAVTAAPLKNHQKRALITKLQTIMGKQIVLENVPDPGILGGIRLEYDGKRVEDTVAHRLEAIGNQLKLTQL